MQKKLSPKLTATLFVDSYFPDLDFGSSAKEVGENLELDSGGLGVALKRETGVKDCRRGEDWEAVKNSSSDDRHRYEAKLELIEDEMGLPRCEGSKIITTERKHSRGTTYLCTRLPSSPPSLPHLFPRNHRSSTLNSILGCGGRADWEAGKNDDCCRIESQSQRRWNKVGDKNDEMRLS